MKKIILIRHAESESNVGGVFEHTHTIKITENGKQQANELAEILDKPDKIIVSKYIRTIETAEPLINKFPETEVHLWMDTHEFHYIDRVKYRNITTEQRDEMSKEYWRKQDPLYRDAENVESFADLVNRVNNVAIKLKKIPDGLNYIFSHGLFMRVLFLVLNNFPDLNQRKNDEGIYLEIMRKFEEFYHNSEISFKNTTRIDITELVENYKI